MRSELKHPRQRRRLLSLVTAAAVLAAFEAASFLFFRAARERFAFASPEQYVIDPARVAGLASHFDATLGWTNHYPTPHEERPRPRVFGVPLLATFGDSYTHCDEVGDAETWQSYLADELRADVYNFGVGGYGPDQALLRFREKSRELATPLVALGVVLENINRVVNRYRPFYYRETGIPLTKPRFLLERDALVLLPNPVSRPEELARLADPAFVHAIGEQDFWYSGAERSRLGFPYLRLLFSPAIWRQALEGGRVKRSEINERPARNLWKDPVARKIFLGILDLFVKDALAMGSRPLILILPGRPNVEARRDGRPIPGFEPVLGHCRERRYDCFDGIAAVSAAPDPPEAAFRPGGHLSPVGNRTVSQALAEWVRQRSFQPSRSRSISSDNLPVRTTARPTTRPLRPT